MVFFTNASIFTDGEIVKGTLVVENRKIVKIIPDAYNSNSNYSKEHIIDCQGGLLLPGCVDCHVHFRDLEQEYKETLETGSMAALSGGVTTVLTMPNTKPSLSTAEMVKKYRELPRKLYCNIGIIGGINEDFNFNELTKMKSIGIYGIKIYPGAKSKELPLEWKQKWTEVAAISKQLRDPASILAQLQQNFTQWQALFTKAKELDLPIIFHPEMPEESTKLHETFLTALGEGMNPDLHLSSPELFAHNESHPIIGNEFSLVQMICSILQQTYADPSQSPRVHFVHISSTKCIDYIAQLKERGFPITFEVSPHHVLLNYTHSIHPPAFGKVLDPLRSPEEQNALWEYTHEGKIDMIGTDHAPHSYEEKVMNFEGAPSGFPGVDIALPLLLSQVAQYRIALDKVVQFYAENPAKIYQIPNKGKIAPGYDADLVLVDRCDPYKFSPDQSFSKAKWSPYTGQTIFFKIKQVYIAGELAFDSSKTFISPKGQWLNHQ